MTRQPLRRQFPGSPLIVRSGQRVAVRRIRWVLVIYALLIALVMAQLVVIQVVDADEYADRSVRQRERTIALPAVRGRIYDRDGDVLATSVDGASIYADPRAYTAGQTADGQFVPPAADAADVAAALAPLLNREPETLQAWLEEDAHFVYLARQLDWEIGQQIADLELPGIGMLTEPKRIYPGTGLAAQVVGFTGIDGNGLQGMELQYDGTLQGRPGTLSLERAPGGLDIATGVRELVASEVGTDLVLTLDRDIQHVAEVAAASTVEQFDAAAASVVAIDVATGDVLAMASNPGFDPNNRQPDEQDAWRNRAVTDVFEPGSTQKALTIAAAIEEGLVDASTSLDAVDGITFGVNTFRDLHPSDEPAWTVAEIMERSSNVGTIQIAQRLGEARLEEYLRKFGYGAPTGIGLPGEADGMLTPHQKWWATSLPTIAIGHGVAVTLTQLANAYVTLANGGRSVPPRIVRGTVGSDGHLVPSRRGVGTQVVSPDTASMIHGMLEAVVSGENGTGAAAAVSGYTVAGKTGTARKPSADGQGYSNQYVATFAGFAPATDPRIVVAVMVDEPYPYYGGIVAAPLFSQVMEAALTARRIPPDRETSPLSVALTEASSQLRDFEGRIEESSDEDPSTDATSTDGSTE